MRYRRACSVNSAQLRRRLCAAGSGSARRWTAFDTPGLLGVWASPPTSTTGRPRRSRRPSPRTLHSAALPPATLGNLAAFLREAEPSDLAGFADSDGDGVPDCFESAVADTDRDTVPDQADPANIDACVPDPGFCPQVPIVGPAWQGMLTLRLAASGIALGRRWSCTLRGH